MRILKIVTLVTTLLFPVVGRADGPFRASLTLQPAQTLPGLPVAFQVHVENVSTERHKISQNATLVVVDGAGNSFTPGWGPGYDAPNTGGFWGSEEWTVVAPGAGVDLTIPLTIDLGSPGWFFDKRFSIPGRYVLTVGLEYGSISEAAGGVFMSSPAVLEIKTPRGADARVWSFMKKLANRDTWATTDWITHGFTVANHVWHFYPDSHYLPYVAGYIPEMDSDAKIEILRRAVQIDPEGPMADVLLMSIAAAFERTSLSVASQQHDLKESIRRSRLARETLQIVIDHAKPYYSTMARRHLPKMFDEEQLAQWSSPR